MARRLYTCGLRKQATDRCIALEMDVEEHKDGKNAEKQVREENAVQLVRVILLCVLPIRCIVWQELRNKLVDIKAKPTDIANQKGREGDDGVAQLCLQVVAFISARDAPQNLDRRIRQERAHNEQHDHAQPMVPLLHFLHFLHVIEVVHITIVLGSIGFVLGSDVDKVGQVDEKHGCVAHHEHDEGEADPSQSLLVPVILLHLHGLYLASQRLPHHRGG